ISVPPQVSSTSSGWAAMARTSTVIGQFLEWNDGNWILAATGRGRATVDSWKSKAQPTLRCVASGANFRDADVFESCEVVRMPLRFVLTFFASIDEEREL